MAAISTVLAYLERALPPAGPIVVDAGAYHETRHLLSTGGLAGRCVVVHSDRFIDAVRSHQPVATIVDAISNRPEVRIANLAALVDVVSTSPTPPAVVVDSSLCSMMDPWLLETLVGIEAPLIVVESLTKHAQLGLDRIPAGVIVADRTVAAALDHLREHLGSNITDLACAALPRPNRSLLLDRLDRQASNARIVAERLTAEGFEVMHPCLPHHPDHARWLASHQACGIIGLAIANGPRLIGDAIAAAARRGVLIENGVGFGFDTTRVYQTSRSVPEASAFFRIAVGLEPVDAIEQVTMALAEAMSGAMH